MKQAQIYVSLQRGSTCGVTSDPWDEQVVTEIHYSIPDMGVPSDVPRFKKMIDWLCNQLQEGKKIHVGCIGGHGRTGLVLSAIVAQLLEEKHAIQYVRKNYCTRAVESHEQVEFLRKHYGVSKVSGAKSYLDSAPVEPNGIPKKWVSGASKKSDAEITIYQPGVIRKLVPVNVTANTKTFVPMASSRCVWRRPS